MSGFGVAEQETAKDLDMKYRVDKTFCDWLLGLPLRRYNTLA